MTHQPDQPTIDGELLTPDEKLLHKPRWQGETRDLPNAIRALAKPHHLADPEDIEDSEAWLEFADQLAQMMQQLSSGVYYILEHSYEVYTHGCRTRPQ